MVFQLRIASDLLRWDTEVTSSVSFELKMVAKKALKMVAKKASDFDSRLDLHTFFTQIFYTRFKDFLSK